MSTLYQMTDWESPSGIFYCEHTSSFPRNVQKWVVPARILGVTPADFLKLLIEKYQPDVIYHNEDCSFVSWGWRNKSKMKAYKNWMNAEARKKNFKI